MIMKRTSTPGGSGPTQKGSAARAIAMGTIGAFGLRALLKRRTAALHSGTTALDDTPPESDREQGARRGDESPGHAPGHRHLDPDRGRTSPRLAHRAWRRWAPRADHTGHPPRM
jgi:hypothetical protein